MCSRLARGSSGRRGRRRRPRGPACTSPWYISTQSVSLFAGTLTRSHARVITHTHARTRTLSLCLDLSLPSHRKGLGRRTHMHLGVTQVHGSDQAAPHIYIAPMVMGIGRRRDRERDTASQSGKAGKIQNLVCIPKGKPCGCCPDGVPNCRDAAADGQSIPVPRLPMTR